MSLRDDLLPVVDSLRALPNTFGLRRYSITIRRRIWAGAKVGLPVGSTPTNSDTVLTPTPRVRVVKAAEVAASGGTYKEGDLRVDKITPRYTSPTTGGYTPEMLNLRPTTAHEDIVVILNGDESGPLEAEVVDFRFDRAFGYSMVVRLTRTTR